MTTIKKIFPTLNLISLPRHWDYLNPHTGHQYMSRSLPDYKMSMWYDGKYKWAYCSLGGADGYPTYARLLGWVWLIISAHLLHLNSIRGKAFLANYLNVMSSKSKKCLKVNPVQYLIITDTGHEDWANNDIRKRPFLFFSLLPRNATLFLFFFTSLTIDLAKQGYESWHTIRPSGSKCENSIHNFLIFTLLKKQL